MSRPANKPVATAPQVFEVELAAINTVTPDPSNARRHSQRNVDAIKSSLRRFGQQRPIIVDGQDVVRAGNGTLAAALQLGWKQIAIVRSELSGPEMTAFAIADNRTAELAEWDDDVLAAELGGLQEDGIDLAELGFTDRDLKKLLGDDLPGGDGGADAKFLIVVTCTTEADQARLIERLQADGRTCRAMMG